ncbi:Bromodomain testis-specific protein [Microtus ochrogaster]|uniref:Bromodomain testis-specific protein n=1 Tax=Microtus ochrogaster TaxID=79684 RepID=A0A8J6GL04_MICOH|nr:Bromodomain testis-specific protein [Microtus ochrogaster]
MRSRLTLRLEKYVLAYLQKRSLKPQAKKVVCSKKELHFQKKKNKLERLLLDINNQLYSERSPSPCPRHLQHQLLAQKATPQCAATRKQSQQVHGYDVSGHLQTMEKTASVQTQSLSEKEVKARNEEQQMQKHLEQNPKEPKVSQENQRELGNGLTLESLSNKMEIKCHGEERDEQQPLEAQDQSKPWLLKDKNLAREKEQEWRRREAWRVPFT